MSTTQQWSVYVRLAADVDVRNEEHVDALASIAADLDERHGAAISAPKGDVDAQAWAEADTAADALEQVRLALTAAALEAGLPIIGDVVEQHVRPWDEFAAEVDTTTLPELVSGPEAAEILGVTRQRVQQLANEHPIFPDPVYQLGVGRLWLRVQIDTFAKKWDRRPGRRPAAAQTGTVTQIEVSDGRPTMSGRFVAKSASAAKSKKAASKTTGRFVSPAAKSRKAPKG